MTAYGQAQLPVVGDTEAHRRARGPAGSLVVGRYMGTVIVTLHGELHLRASVYLAGVLRDLIDGQGNLAVVVDLADVDGIDRSGLDVLASAADRTAGRGGVLRLGGATGEVFDALSLAGMGRLFTMPLEEAHRAPRRRGDTSRRAAINAHPAGTGPFDRTHRGDAS